MPITYRVIGKTSVFGTYIDPDDSSTTPPLSEWRVSKLTSNELEFNLTHQGFSIRVSYLGQFNLTGLTIPVNSLENFNSALTRGEINAIVQSGSIFLNGENAGLLTANPAIPYADFSELIDSTNLVTMKRILAGNDVFISSNTPQEDAGTYLYGGNDSFYHNHPILQNSDTFFGGDGLDTAIIPGKASNYSIITSKTIWDPVNKAGNLSGFVVSDTTKTINTLRVNEVERLKFADNNVALDIGPSQNAGSLYMLYKAAFNRAPDEGGMGYWLAQVDGGKNLVNDIATGFVKAPEFVAKYGTNPTNAFYVDQLYLNVLGRPGEAGGVAYWNQELNSGARSKAEVLVQFATLPEGAALVANLIANGIAYTEWVG